MRHIQSFNSAAVQSAAQCLGERIRTARKAQNRSLGDLESACRVQQQTLACIERSDSDVSIDIFLSVLGALRELFNFELLVSHPNTPSHLCSGIDVPLERDL